MKVIIYSEPVMGNPIAVVVAPGTEVRMCKSAGEIVISSPLFQKEPEIYASDNDDDLEREFFAITDFIGHGDDGAYVVGSRGAE